MLFRSAMLEETRVQVINLQTENQKLEILANQSSDLMSELTQIKEQKESLSTEFSILKSSVFESERKEITSKDPKFDSKNFKVLEEIQNLIIEGMTLCKTLDTSAKEVLMVYNEKLKKANDCIKVLPEYTKTSNNQERLNISQSLKNLLSVLNCIPKKSSNLKIIDECVINGLTGKIDKISDYEKWVAKCTEINNVAAKKYAEYELRLSYYNSSDL